MAEPRILVGDVTCPCGCGQSFSPIGSRGRTRSFFSPACSLRVHRISGGGEGRRHTDETRALLSERAKRPKPWLRGNRNGMAGRTGELNPNWRGGTSPERQRLYAGAAWRNLRRLVVHRDGGLCAECGSANSLHMHHLKPWATHPDLRFEPSNIITLCAPCHYARHAKGGEPNQ